MMRAQEWVVWGLTGMALAACTAGAQLDTRTFELEYLDAREASQIIDPYVYGDRPEAPGQVSVTGNLISVRETADNLDKIARVLAEYDRPTPSVRLHFKIIQADGWRTTDTAIADVEAALRKLFRFQGYRLVAEALIGGVEGSRLAQAVAGEGGPYAIRARIEDVRASGDSGTVRIGVALFLQNAGDVIETTVNLRAGQTAVLGNAQADPTKPTLILTVRPELVET